MEAKFSFETLANFLRATQQYNPEDRALQIHSYENLKSYMPKKK
jgi:hypothetical protein